MSDGANRWRLQVATLHEHVAVVEQSAAALRHSLAKCEQAGLKAEYTLDELDDFEASKRSPRHRPDTLCLPFGRSGYSAVRIPCVDGFEISALWMQGSVVGADFRDRRVPPAGPTNQSTGASVLGS